MTAIGGVIRGSAISAMFDGHKHRGNGALTDDCARIPDVLKDVLMKHKRRKCGIELSRNTISNVRL
jgi:hypothetical protein